MWAREPHAVASNWSRTKDDYQMMINNLSVRLETLLPQLGCPELKDRVGVTAAIATLAASLCPGRNSTNIQWDAMQKTQTWISNIHDTGRGYSCKTIIGLDRIKQYLLSCPTFGKWFSRFIHGAQLRMGMIRKQNEALTSILVLAVGSGWGG